MWGVEDNAETMAMNPWNGVPQTQVWPGMGRGTNGQPTFSGARVGETRGTRAWIDHQVMQGPGGQWNPQPSIQPSQWALPPNQPGGPGGWPLQQAWGAAANSPNGTYAEQAKKSMPTLRGQAVTGRFDGQPQQAWGGMKVDQQTPWDTGSGQSLHAEQKGEWTNPAAAPVAVAGSRWGAGGAQWTPAPHTAAAPEWAHHRHDPTGTAHWNAAMQPHPNAMVPAGVPGASWGQPQQPLSTPSDQYDPNPQAPGPWVAPQPTEMNNDMMWHDPNPKQKKVQRDTGTGIWGDPGSQQLEIKRWKDADQEDYSHVPCAAPTGGDWNNIPMSSGPVSTNTSPPATAAQWAESQSTHPGNTVNDGTERWNAAQQQTASWGDPGKPMSDVQQSSNSDVPMPTAAAPNTVEHSMGETMRTAESGNASHTALTQQIADQLRIAVSKGLIDVSLIRQQLPQTALVILNSILQKAPKLEQAQQEYAQLLRNMSNNASNSAQKMEADRLAVEISTLHNEIIQLRNGLNEPLIKARSQAPAANGIVPMQSDGQSRLNQWKQANAEGSAAEKMPTSASDGNVSALAAAAGNLTLDDKVDWKRGMLDWSPPPGGGAQERPGGEGAANMEKEETAEKVPTSKAQTVNGTPSPQLDDGPQEFVPGKKWEWRDPNKVAEDPNATPGNCKPNPLLSTSSSNASFQMAYGQNVTQGGFPNEVPVTKGPFVGWNGAPYGNEMYGRARPPTTGQPAVAQRMPGMHMQQQQGFARSMSSPGQQHFQAAARWIVIQAHGHNANQTLMLCHKLGKLEGYCILPGSGNFCLRYAEPAEAIVERMKAEYPFWQPKIVSDADFDRGLKLRGLVPMNASATSWGPGAPGPGVDPNAFPGLVLPGDLVQQQQQQQHIFHNDDLTRPY